MDRVRHGFARITAEVVQQKTVLTRIAHKAPARLLPLKTAAAASAGAARCVLSSLGGGLLSGDALDFEIVVEDGATLHLGTQASTKVYKGPAGASQTLEASVGSGALLVSTPDAVTPFRASTYAQTQRFELADGASVAVVDWLGAGRAANGERWAFDAATSKSRYVVGGAEIIDALRLGGPAAHFDVDTTTEGYDVAASLVLVGPRAAAAAAATRGVAGDLAARRGARRLEKGPASAGRLALEGAVVMGVGDAGGGATVARLVCESPDDAYRVLRACLEPLACELGEAPYADRIHAVGGFGAAARPRTCTERRPAAAGADGGAPLRRDQRLALAQLVDSALPTGGFAHSGGVEAAFQLGLLPPGDEAAALRFLDVLLASHAAVQAPFFAAAHGGGDAAALDAGLGALLAATAPAHRASLAAGAAVSRVAAELAPAPARAKHGAVALGALAARLGLPRDAALDAFAFTAVRDAASAAVRLGVLGPSRAVALQADVLARGASLAPGGLADAAPTSPLLEAAHAAHDLLEMRLFRS